MKLGTETGSFFNHIMSKSANAPDVNKGATILYWTDRLAYFVNEVSPDGKTVVIEKAKAIRTDELGMSDSQSYRYERDENVRPEIIRFKYGKWRRAYEDEYDSGKIKYSPINIIFGTMNEYYDFSF